jgi:dihydroxyacetone kinase-like protein
VNGIDTDLLVAMIANTALRLAASADELSRIDAVAGDGDHGVNVSAAFADASARLAEARPAHPSDVFLIVGRSFSEGGGGSAGALFGAYFAALGKRLALAADPEVGSFAEGLEAGSLRVAGLGRVALGEKTMFDALEPASRAARDAVAAGGNLAVLVGAAAEAAARGAAATAGMVAKAGRARYAESGAVGTQDPGALSVSLMFAAWEEVVMKGTDQ